MKDKILILVGVGVLVLLVAGWVALLLAPPFGTAVAIIVGVFVYSAA